MNKELFEEAKTSSVLTEDLISNLLESMEYSSISFINWTIDVLKILRTRIERGDKITDEVTRIVYDKKSFQHFVKDHFSSYIYAQVFEEKKKAEKVYFSLNPDEEGISLVMADSSTEKIFKWISSLNERFALSEMIATKIVYIRDNKNNTYMPFISQNGKYCRYNEETGKIVEVQ